MTVARLLQAVRYWRRRPSLAFAVVGIAAIGIGATLVAFSAFDAVFVRSLPFRSSERLVSLSSVRGGEDIGVSWLDYVDWREDARALEAAAAYFEAALHVEVDGHPIAARGATVTTGLFPLLGVATAAGPGFAAAGSPALGRQVVVSDAFARRHLRGPARALGRPLRIEGNVYEVCGVLAAGPSFPPRSDLWIALEPMEGGNPRGLRGLGVVARLPPSTSLESAAARFAVLATSQAQAHPETNAGVSIRLTPLAHELGRGLRLPVALLLAACGVLLIVTVANVAGLLLVQLVERLPEVAVRQSLGASRSRIAAQLAVESALACLLGGAIGLLGASALIAGPLPVWIRSVVELPPWSMPRVDLRVAGCALALALAMAGTTALLPVLVTGSRSLSSWLREAGRSGIGRTANRGLTALASAQTGLAVVLLVTAALLTVSFARLAAANAGFDLAVRAVTLRSPVFGTLDAAQRAAQLTRLVSGLEGLPGIDAAALNTDLPLSGREVWHRTRVAADGGAASLTAGDTEANVQRVSPGYFATLRVALRAGRDFVLGDDAAAPPVAIVSSSLAARLWPGREAVGRRLTLGEGAAGRPTKWWLVVGVASDVRHQGLALGPSTDVYVPFFQSPSGEEVSLVLRGEIASHELADRLERLRVLHAPSFVASQVYPLEDLRSHDLAKPRLLSALSAGFALTALLLTATGLAGVMSCWERNHRRELALRAALGAPPAGLARLVLRRGLRIAATGAAGGILAMPWLARPLRELLYDGGPSLGWALAGGVVLALLVSTLSLLGPARRAARLDVVTVLGS